MTTPSESLLDRILQKKSISVKVPSLEWGRTNEPVAKEAYISLAQPKHMSFDVKSTGLHVHPKFPHLGASPDGLISCSCCGDGLLEIKCPYSKRDYNPTQINDHFYLNKTDQGLKLSKNHDYYKQIQGQMAIRDHSYTDFVCWTPQGIHVERVNRDTSFFNQMETKLTDFFLKCVFPHVLCGGKIEDENNTDKDNKLELTVRVINKFKYIVIAGRRNME